MTELIARLRRFLRELKRRNVYRVAVTYGVVAFVTLQAAQLVFPATTLEGLYDKLVVLAFVGFPIALVLAWAFEMTPEGVRRTEAVEGEDAAGAAAYQWIGLAVVVLLAGGLWYVGTGEGRQPAPGTAGATDTARAQPRVDTSAIAVLPFENMGGEESDQFTQGVHDGLLTRLSNVSDLSVISRTSVTQYEDTDKTMPEVARELGAGWIVEGAVQQSAGQVQVNAQLIDAREDAHQWAKTYQRELTPENLFAIQSELTRKIARSLEAQLSPEEIERVERRPTGDLKAYELYVQGRRQLSQRRFTEGRHPGEPVRDAVRNFRRAIARDSSFALAWAGLADAAALYAADVPDSVTAPTVEQEFAARRALQLAPNLAEARASVGFLHVQQMNAPAAVRELRRALEMRPSYWEAHHWLGTLLFTIGRAHRALEHLSVAVELNPRHARARHVLYDAYLATGQTEKSLREARRQQRLGLEEISAVGGEVRALYHLGRYSDAERLAMETLAGLSEGTTWREVLLSYLVTIRAAKGDTTGARKTFERVRAHQVQPETQRWVDPAALGWAHAALGETEAALGAFEQLPSKAWSSLGGSASLRYGIHLDLDPFRGRTRYRELIREANRAWGLDPDGSLPDSVDVSFEPHADD